MRANLQHPHILPLHDSGEGQRFLAIQAGGAAGAGVRASVEINVVLNWFEELRQRMGN